MRTVWKFPIGASPSDVEMPSGARVIAVHAQGETLTLWADVPDKMARREMRRFVIRGTGWDVDEAASYIGTCFAGSFVWHVFEVTS